MQNKKTAIILFNLGGPDKLSSVRHFLFNLFNDGAIISLFQPFRLLLAWLISTKRAKKAKKIYAQMGGKSPLLDITNSQAHALTKELSFFGEFKTFVCMRYWHPMSKEVAKNVLEYNPDQIILLPLYPQFSSATTASSFADFLANWTVHTFMREEKIPVKKICCYFEEPEFILSHAKLIKQTINKHLDNNINKFRFLFSAHGLPQSLVDQGDPYVFQIEKTTNKIVEKLRDILSLKAQEHIDFKICYQSKVGPMQWTQPSLDNELRRAIIDEKIPVIVPVSFVSDHSETLVELDIDYKNLAQSLSAKNYLRVPALNIDEHFIKALAEICKKAAIVDEKSFCGSSAKCACSHNLKKCGFDKS